MNATIYIVKHEKIKRINSSTRIFNDCFKCLLYTVNTISRCIANQGRRGDLSLPTHCITLIIKFFVTGDTRRYHGVNRGRSDELNQRRFGLVPSSSDDTRSDRIVIASVVRPFVGFGNRTVGDRFFLRIFRLFVFFVFRPTIRDTCANVSARSRRVGGSADRDPDDLVFAPRH